MSIEKQELKKAILQAIKDGTITDNITLKAFVISERFNRRVKDGKDGESITGEKGESITGEKGKDGKTPTKKELLSLIKPLIPKAIPGKDGESIKGEPAEPVDTDSIVKRATEQVSKQLKDSIPTIDQIEQDLPKLGESVRNSLELLKDDERISSDAIKGLGARETALLKRADSILDNRTQFLIAKLSRTNTNLTALISSLLTAPENLTSQCDGSNQVFTTTRSIKAVLWVNIYGGGLIEGEDFTITDDKEITLSTFAPETGEELFVKYI